MKDIAKEIAERSKKRLEDMERQSEKHEENFKRVFVEENLPHLGADAYRPYLPYIDDVIKWNVDELRIIQFFYKELADMIHETSWRTPPFDGVRRERIHIESLYDVPGSGTYRRFYLPWGWFGRYRHESGLRYIKEPMQPEWYCDCCESEIYKKRLFKKAIIDQAVDEINQQIMREKEKSIFPCQYVKIEYLNKNWGGTIVLFSDGDVYDTEHWNAYREFSNLRYCIEDLKDENKRKEMAFIMAVKINEGDGKATLDFFDNEILLSLNYLREYSGINYQKILEEYNSK